MLQYLNDFVLILFINSNCIILGSPVTSHAEQVAQANAVMTYRQIGTTTSPVVSNLIREDLTSHVKTWPADILSKQVIVNY